MKEISRQYSIHVMPWSLLTDAMMKELHMKEKHNEQFDEKRNENEFKLAGI